MNLRIDDLLGLIYVSAWSISMYPPIIKNWKCNSSSAISIDFVLLNAAGYFYLLTSLILQVYFWIPVSTELLNTEQQLLKPKVSVLDIIYCSNGFIMTVVLLTQVVWGRKLWNFLKDKKRRMTNFFHKLLCLSIFCFTFITFQYIYNNIKNGWSNSETLSYCNQLFLMKISMSLVKYIPQVTYNYNRKSMKGYAIQGVFLDTIGGVASLAQLVVQLQRDQNFSFLVFITNFGKIGLGLVTLVFNFIFISQWMIYES
ncbi:hypothetical protein TBLA_0I02440 [Henningerozyma blattae CBS 6284]|uniref:Uncharacterized protein n=1 Tax=Henningerozyma blattae (strain ATCC 34711 / CBS 6284 / DSM 70876 / NBRC 10599 / NRRL Y-10934 / UCD 77-7) TaxID=1071380 RepID=I2H950_HENB6|nr:hypothetical protein TBLA_0I02440 [Tetrapisispora blattae CBS 6284]CCH62902.1 hypothetical protein TBLA_0I02440 [Tetrapisispora blattae CBS 6284]